LFLPNVGFWLSFIKTVPTQNASMLMSEAPSGTLGMLEGAFGKVGMRKTNIHE
jgi:hypothetical protein